MASAEPRSMLAPEGDGGQPGGPPLPDVLEEHLAELAFLSVQRRKLLFSPEVTLPALRRHEERIEAHRDGLAVAEAAGVQAALAALAGADAWLACTASRVWLEHGHPRPTEVVDRLVETPEEAIPGWREAMRTLPVAVVERLLPPRIPAHLPPLVQAVLIEAGGWAGLLPAPEVDAYAQSEHAIVRGAVSRALGVGAAPGADFGGLLGALARDADERVRRVALWSLVLQRPDEAAARIRRLAEARVPDAFALRLLGLLGAPADLEILLPLLDEAPVRLAAIHALGDLGRVEAAGRLLDLIESTDEEVRAAAEQAFRMLVGAVPPPGDGTAPGSPERAFWKRGATRFGGGQRWLRGASFPWTGPADDEPMESRWRAAVLTAGSEAAWLRREVPDGFFTAVPCDEARAGE